MTPGAKQAAVEAAAPAPPPHRSSSPPPPTPAWRPNRPNMLISGTPGVGKTTLAAQLAEQLGLRHIDVGQFARDRNLLADHDAQHDAFYMHEDAVLDELEPILSEGAVILDHHSSDWYPERWFQMAVVLSTSTEALYDRLQARGYSQRKIEHNVQAEIMQIIFEETVSSYPRLKVLHLHNDSDADAEANLARLKREWTVLHDNFTLDSQRLDS